jgi:hypothetical protein
LTRPALSNPNTSANTVCLAGHPSVARSGGAEDLPTAYQILSISPGNEGSVLVANIADEDEKDDAGDRE